MRKYIVGIICSLCCLMPISVLASEELIIGGNSIGIEVQYDGVMISGTYSYKLANGELYDPLDSGIASGDILQEVNGIAIHNMSDLYTEVSKYQNEENNLPIVVKRKEETLQLSLRTIYDRKQQNFKSGLYIKDKIIGVGTLTYYDPANQSFGALGHEILDSDMKELAEISSGSIYHSTVTSITKAQKNVAGEKNAAIDYEQVEGTIQKNTDIGIYGTYENMPEEVMKLEWAEQSQVHTGAAQIYTVLQGDKIEAFDIEITKLHTQTEVSVKGIEFQIVDPSLLEQTNGIIQGMSGSPIIQDGKIIGAVTHVITSHPSDGYGVYIEWMLDQSKQMR